MYSTLNYLELYCTALHCTSGLYCTQLHCFGLYCTIMHCLGLYSNVLYCTGTKYTTSIAQNCTQNRDAMFQYSALFKSSTSCTALISLHSAFLLRNANITPPSPPIFPPRKLSIITVAPLRPCHLAGPPPLRPARTSSACSQS